MLRPGGRLALVMDISKEAPDAPVPEDVGARMNFRVYAGTEVLDLLTDAGFVRTDFTSKPECGKGWLRAYGDKPDAVA